MGGSAAPVAAAAAGADEDLWVCKKCGWTYPNPHPSAKHRKNHRRHCGKVKGLDKTLVAPAPQLDPGSSDDVSSDDEDHHHRAPEAARVEPVNAGEKKPAVTEEPKTVPTRVEEQQPVGESVLKVKDEAPSADNSPDEISGETREEMKKVSFDPHREPSLEIQEEKPEIQEEEPKLVSKPEETQPVSKHGKTQPVPKQEELSKKEEPQPVSENGVKKPVSKEEEPQLVPRELPLPKPTEPQLVSKEHEPVPKASQGPVVTTPDEATSTSASGEPLSTPPLEKPQEPEILKDDKPIEVSKPDPPQEPERLKQDKPIEVSEPSVLKPESSVATKASQLPQSLKQDKRTEVAPDEPLAASDSQQAGAPSQDSWEQLLDAQLAAPPQNASDTSSSANNEHLSSTAFPQSSFTADKELTPPSNGNPFIASDISKRSLDANTNTQSTKAQAPDKRDINLFDIKESTEAPGDSGEASSSTSQKGEGDIKPHVALKALFDDDPRPRQQQQQQSAYNDEQEALVRSGSRRNSNVLQRVIETVKNSPAKFGSSSSSTGATKKNEEPLNNSNSSNRSKSRWSSYICCSQVR